MNLQKDILEKYQNKKKSDDMTIDEIDDSIAEIDNLLKKKQQEIKQLQDRMQISRGKYFAIKFSNLF